MAWTDLSAAFGYGTKLTSTQQQQLRDNVNFVMDFVNSASLTDHGPLLGSGTGAITAMGVGSYGAIMIGQGGADPQWKHLSGAILVDSAGVTSLGTNLVGQGQLQYYQAGDLLEIADNAEETTTTQYPSYAVMKEAYIPRHGTLRISFQMATAGATPRAYIAKNSTAVSSVYIAAGAYSLDVGSLAAGDYIRIYADTSNGGYATSISSFCLKCANPMNARITG